jgi:GntR family transcriptional regulator, negative regulator for fad regulon and positive regulator of fabA
MSNWSAPQRPAAYAEEALLTAILDGTYPPGSMLPGERDLAAQLGVTRPTLRETMQRLACDGWLTIQQGKSTRVNDFWREGGLNTLGAMVRYSRRLPPNFVSDLLEVRLALAPAYTRAAVIRDPRPLLVFLEGWQSLEDTPSAFAVFDWGLHRMLTLASQNPVYTLILNGFAGFYEKMACLYFALGAARASSRGFYARLAEMAGRGDADGAESLAREVMLESLALWGQARTGEAEDETMEWLGR